MSAGYRDKTVFAQFAAGVLPNRRRPSISTSLDLANLNGVCTQIWAAVDCAASEASRQAHTIALPATYTFQLRGNTAIARIEQYCLARLPRGMHTVSS